MCVREREFKAPVDLSVAHPLMSSLTDELISSSDATAIIKALISDLSYINLTRISQTATNVQRVCDCCK